MFRIIIIMLIAIIGITQSYDEMIADFSQHIHSYNKCGLNSRSVETDGQCFGFKKYFEFYSESTKKDKHHGESPWMVTIVANKVWKLFFIFEIHWPIRFCGGVIINEEWVITAAHCLDDVNRFTVYIYSHDKTYKSVNAKYLIKHQNYNHSESVVTDDIGLIKLEERIDFEESVVEQLYERNPICLLTQKPDENLIEYRLSKSLTRKGFFARANGFQGQSDQPQVGTFFLKVTGPSSLKFWAIFGTNVCKGDSGSPIWVYLLGRAVLVGIIQGIHSKDRCATTGTAAYLPGYVDWIKHHLEFHVNDPVIN